MMEDRLVIRSDRLTVSLARPDGTFYTGSRFDHAGFVCDILLDGKTQFAAPEVMEGEDTPTSGGVGLNSMYMLEGDEESVEVGKPYIRMGAGYLKRPPEKWAFMRMDYEYEPFEVSYAQKDGEITFTTVAEETGGFAYRQIKRVRVRGNQIFIETTLVNTGERDMSIKEYNHNFLHLGDYPTDEHTRLELAALTRLGEKIAGGAPMTFTEDSITWPSSPEGYFMCHEDHPNRSNEKPYSWRLSRDDASVSVAERDSFHPDRAVIWGKRYVVSPEMYHIFTVSAGDSHTWTRTWTFEG